MDAQTWHSSRAGGGPVRIPVMVLCLVLSASRSLFPQAVITGTVREDSTGRPLSGVEVVVEGLDRRAVTDVNGHYLLDRLSPGSYVALFRRIGYHAVREALRVRSGDTAWVNTTLVATAVEIAPVEVKAPNRPPTPRIESNGFEERRNMGFGKFIDSTTLRRLEFLGVTDVLRRYTSVTLVHGGNGEVWAQSARLARLSGERCWMSVVVDGIVIYRGGQGPASRRPDLSRDFPVSDLEAIEVYHSAAETPAEFGGTSAACGTIVLWTRRALKQ